MPAAGGDEGFAATGRRTISAQSAAKLFCAPQRAQTLPPPRGVLPSPPFSFRWRSRHGPSGPRRECGVDAGSPCVGRPESIQSKGAPTALCAVGEQRERAAGAVQERTRQGDNRGISAEMQCGTASRAARDFTGEPCSPINPFFLDGGFWLGESASRKPGGGVGGAFLLQEGQMASKPPTIFLWYRQAAPSLSKKEMVGPTVPHTECGFPVPRRARNPSSPAGESLVPRRARNCSLSAGEPHCQVIPESQSLRPLRGHLPLHMGGCPCPSRVFCRKSKRPAAGVS